MLLSDFVELPKISLRSESNDTVVRNTMVAPKRIWRKRLFKDPIRQKSVCSRFFQQEKRAPCHVPPSRFLLYSNPFHHHRRRSSLLDWLASRRRSLCCCSMQIVRIINCSWRCAAWEYAAEAAAAGGQGDSAIRLRSRSRRWIVASLSGTSPMLSTSLLPRSASPRRQSTMFETAPSTLPVVAGSARERDSWS